MRARLFDARALVVVAALLLGAAVAFPLGVLASHQFSDVPTSSTYHADIDAIRDAGVTTGCAPNLYCPKDFVTREQMAAFLNRLGALQAGKGPVVNATRLDGLDSTQFARSDVTRNGHFNCPGPAMVDAIPGQDWTKSTSSVYLNAGPSGGFACPVNLPQGATVTALHAHLVDETTGEWVTCILTRTSKDQSSSGEMADTGQSGNGQTIDSDTTIENPVVDNANNFYQANCTIAGYGDDVQLWGVTVDYTVTGVPID